uniref:Galectin n=1 Tax=Seriola lalandi dorsalis TaxID=1841481 RepID=A0A3B4WBY8_SERLL
MTHSEPGTFGGLGLRGSSWLCLVFNPASVCALSPRSDVALHFSPRFKGSPCVVCNSLLQESWGKEETLHQLPYKRGAPFETIILVHDDVFKFNLIIQTSLYGGETQSYSNTLGLICTAHEMLNNSCFRCEH